jgi:hypothetical protein
MTTDKTWTVSLDEDPETGELILPFSDEMLEGLGWTEGDTLVWTDRGDGSWSLSKKQEEKEWVMVETVQQFRHRYMVEVPVGKAEWALDTVVMEDAKEFSQLHLGETIVSHRVVTQEEALAICDIDNDYVKSWTDELKMKSFFTKDGEKVEIK